MTASGGDGVPAPARRRPTAPRPRIDPRIRERRIEVLREEGRRRLRVLVASATVAALVAAGAGLTRSSALDVDYVDVRGAEQTPRALVLRATGLGGRPLMVEVHTDRIVRRVEGLPWVKDATARRQWPGTVRIDVTERVPAAVVPVDAGERWAVTDATGRVLSVGTVKPAGLPALANVARVGAPGSSIGREAAAALVVVEAVPPPLRERVADVATGPGGEVELNLAGGVGVVRLGPPEGLRLKFAALATLLERADMTKVSVIDVRVPRAPVLTRR
ncbi:MAG: FtsQ-type POTRA domain-containing protein [Acidimicrobiales bacterium]